jgi:hypothetical protein
MVTKKIALNITQKRLWLGSAFAFGTCAAFCAAPIFLWMVGAGFASSLFCTPKEALTAAGLGGLAVAGLFAVRKRITTSSECDCGHKAITSGDADTAITCDLTVFSLSERIKHMALAKSLLGKARQVIEHEDGFTFVFEQSARLEMKIPDWVTNEKRCCPFFLFDLSRTDTPPSLKLRISGPNGAKEILRTGLTTLVRQPF